MLGAGAYSGIRPHNTEAYSGVRTSQTLTQAQVERKVAISCLQALAYLKNKNPEKSQESLQNIKPFLNDSTYVNHRVQGQLENLFVDVLQLGDSHDFVDKNYTDKCEALLDDIFSSFSHCLNDCSWNEIVGMATSKIETQEYWAIDFLSKCLPHVPRETKQKLFDMALENTSSPYCAPLYPQLISTLRNDYGGELGPQRLLAWKQWMHRT